MVEQRTWFEQWFEELLEHKKRPKPVFTHWGLANTVEYDKSEYSLNEVHLVGAEQTLLQIEQYLDELRHFRSFAEAPKAHKEYCENEVSRLLLKFSWHLTRV